MRATAGGLSFTSYYYYADLANGSQFRPPANVMSTFINEDGHLDGNRVYLQLYDGGAWVDAIATTPYQSTINILTNTSKYVQIANDQGSARKIQLSGVEWG